MLRVSSIEQSFDNIIYESNPWNENFDDLPLMVMKGWLLNENYFV